MTGAELLQAVTIAWRFARSLTARAASQRADAVHHLLGAGLLEFLAQPVRGRVDRAAGAGGGGIVAPYVAGELCTVECLAGLAGERVEQVELQPCERQFAVVDPGCACVEVEHEAGDLQQPRAGRCRASAERFDRGCDQQCEQSLGSRASAPAR